MPVIWGWPTHTPLIAFVNDDVDFDAGWLDSIVDSFHHRAEADVMGGNTIPLFPGQRPLWLQDNLFSWYSCSTLGENSRWMNEQEFPYGVNISFRRAVFDKTEGFSSKLGRYGDNLLSGEETELCKRLKAQGCLFWYCAEALLHHRIPPERLSPAWLLQRVYWQGISDSISERLPASAGAPVNRTSIASLARATLSACTGDFLSPRRLWWHLRSRSIQGRIAFAYLRGHLAAKSRWRLGPG